ncbi:MAG: MgtC/SapB family protein [Flavobacteriales bacterium]|nr:MgtC/SapB family protein [Flavobacteriales bacterium]HRO38558.1 MgtC/SapB family protein [Flavobacteriales bacterium]HRP80849.1 MgtC/SapB family protein [Flavobacteriales bacterium]
MLDPKEILIRLALAALFGALIGLERERKNRVAGLRTHMMVSVGACLIMIVSAFGFADILGQPNVTLDPSRIAAQVVSGIGFIGAGTILFVKQGSGTIRGLTTAAGLWTVAAIGLATGGGLYFAAGATTIIAILILWALQPLEQAYLRKFKQITLEIITKKGSDNATLLNDLLHKEGLDIQSFSVERSDDEFVFQLKFDNSEVAKVQHLVDRMKSDPVIKEIFWTQ